MCSTCCAIGAGTGWAPSSTLRIHAAVLGRVNGRGQGGQGRQGAPLRILHALGLAVQEGIHLRRAARVGHGFALGAAQQQGTGAGQRKGGSHGLGVFRVGVAAHHDAAQALVGQRVQQLDQAVCAVAQAQHAAHLQQAFQAGQQQRRGRIGHAAGGGGSQDLLRRHAQVGQHVGTAGAALLGGAAMHQHAQALARQQQRQQRGQQWQLAGAVVAGQHHQGALGCSQAWQPLVDGVQKARHFFGRFALDAHGNAEGAHLQVAGRAVQHLAQQVGGLGAVQGACALFAASDVFEVVADGHGAWSGMKTGRVPIVL
jgi:hypothetical protein